MNSKNFFEKAKLVGITDAELSFNDTSELNISLFHKEIDSYSISNQSVILARGIYKDKLGFATTEDVTKNNIDFLIDGIKSTASLIEKVEKPIIFKGSEKYHKKNLFNKELSSCSVDKKLAKLHELEDIAYSLDKRITEVQVSYSESTNASELANSNGLKLKQKNNYYYYFLSVVAKNGEETKSNYDLFLDADFTKFNPRELATKVVEEVLTKFNGTSIKPKAYKAVLNQHTVADLMTALINTHTNAENVQKKTSLFMGKLNQQVLSKKITIEERPLDKNCFFSYFDDEGVAKENLKIINKGVLSTYLYNLETAQKDHVESNGNATRTNTKIGISASSLVLKPGRMSEDELIKKVGNGVYISSITGLHAGLNPSSGDFSLEAEGYHIVDGKKAGALSLITVSGNLIKVFNDVIGVANNSLLLTSSTTTPSIAIKNLKVSS